MSATSQTSPVRPTAAAECVRRFTCTNTATSENCHPISETSSPTQIRLKSRETRSGERSMANRRTLTVRAR